MEKYRLENKGLEYSVAVYIRTETRKRTSMTIRGRGKLSTVLTFLWCPVAILEPSKGAELGIHPLSATSGGDLDSSSSAFHRPRNLYDTCFVFIVSGLPSIYELAYFEFPATRKRRGCRFSWIVAGDRAQSRLLLDDANPRISSDPKETKDYVERRPRVRNCVIAKRNAGEDGIRRKRPCAAVSMEAVRSSETTKKTYCLTACWRLEMGQNEEKRGETWRNVESVACTCNFSYRLHRLADERVDSW